MMGRESVPDERRVAWLASITAVIALYAVAVGLTGGFDVRIAGMRLRSHSWMRPALVAGAGILLLIRVARPMIAPMFARAWALAERRAVQRALVGGAMAWTLAAGVVFGTFANGGADSYGYVGQARLFAEGKLTDVIPLRGAFTWPDVEATLTPLGFTAGQGRGVIAPLYPPGLPLLLAPLTVSERAIYLLVPAFGMLLVWVLYRLGLEMGDALAGAVAAMLVSFSPTFLYQLVQPMSDVPAAACWLLALLVASRGSSGACAAAGAIASVAILIRPNLAPLAGLVLAAAVTDGSGGRIRRARLFVAALLPGLFVLGWIQQVRYGSPLASGYGKIEDAFAIANILPNLARYPRWLSDSHTWFIWLSLAGPFWIVRRSGRRRLAWIAFLMTAAVWAAYLPYVPFQIDEWFYSRFLLVAIALMLFFAAAAALWGLRRLPLAVRFPVSAALVAVLIGALVVSARTRGAFEIKLQERKYPLTGAFVRDRLPASAIVIAAQHSGSIRYYAGRPTLRWDILGAGRLDDALATLRAQGFEPFLVLDSGELEPFRQRFDARGQRAVHRLSPLAVLGDARIYAFD